MTGTVHHTSASRLLSSLGDESIDMVYTDPPFGTGDVQKMARRRSGAVVSKIEYCDRYDN
jgi:16S rRNA G966 N2-methylase RsmD